VISIALKILEDRSCNYDKYFGQKIFAVG